MHEEIVECGIDDLVSRSILQSKGSAVFLRNGGGETHEVDTLLDSIPHSVDHLISMIDLETSGNPDTVDRDVDRCDTIERMLGQSRSLLAELEGNLQRGDSVLQQILISAITPKHYTRSSLVGGITDWTQGLDSRLTRLKKRIEGE